MKKIVLLFAAMAIVFSGSVLAGCKKDKDEDTVDPIAVFVGTWTATVFYDKSPAGEWVISEQAGVFIITFNTDKTFQSTEGSNEYSGTFIYDSSTATFTLNYDDGSLEFTVISVSPTELMIEHSNGEMRMFLVKTEV